jgi:hypothetical protein
MTATKLLNIFEASTIELVPIPDTPARGAKGTTLHDAEFKKLLNFKQALRIPEHEFGGIRKALQRFLDNRELRQKVSMRQKKDHRTKTYTIWLVNVPPQVVIKRKEDA